MQRIMPSLNRDIGSPLGDDNGKDSSKKTCQHAIANWGTECQLDMVVEECSELQKALMKYRRYKHTESWRAKVIEEAADVSIMLEQLVLMLSTDSEFKRTRNYKLQRLEKMLESQMPRQTCENDKGNEIEFL